MDHSNGTLADARPRLRQVLNKTSDAPCFGMGCPYHNCAKYRAVEEAPGCSTERATCFDGTSFPDHDPVDPPVVKATVRAIALVLTRPMPPLVFMHDMVDIRANSPVARLAKGLAQEGAA
jgi:hypothetical protein